MVNKKAVFNELSEIFGNEHNYSDGKLYSKLYMDFTAAECFDDDYFNNLIALKGKYSPNDRDDNSYNAVIPYINKLSFKDCCTLLSFLLRAERWSEGWFEECLQNGSVKSLLERARDTLYEL